MSPPKEVVIEAGKQLAAKGVGMAVVAVEAALKAGVPQLVVAGVVVLASAVSALCYLGWSWWDKRRRRKQTIWQVLVEAEKEQSNATSGADWCQNQMVEIALKQAKNEAYSAKAVAFISNHCVNMGAGAMYDLFEIALNSGFMCGCGRRVPVEDLCVCQTVDKPDKPGEWTCHCRNGNKCHKMDAESSDFLLLLSSHRAIGGRHSALFTDIRRIARHQLNHALADVNDGRWKLFVEDGDLKMYSMEQEVEDGIVVDPLKALHAIDGVSAHEFINLFFQPDIKKEWDDTIERCNLVEQISPHTVVLHQIHKRIWPTARRESLFWSQRLNVSSECRNVPDARDAWMVCSQSIERDDVPLSDSSAVRVKLTIAMLCQTIVKSRGKSAEQLGRDDVRCKITYVAEVHPGGWVLKFCVRQVNKREYPKFLRTFSKYVQDKVKGRRLEL